MRRIITLGALSLLVMLAMAAPSAAVVTFSLIPQHGSADCGGETVVGLWANSPDPINNFQLALTYDESCVNIVDVDWPVGRWMLTDWNETATPCHDENGIEWLKAWSLFNVGSGAVKLCDITFRCNDADCCYCVSNLNFTCGLDCGDCAIVSGNEAGALPVAWIDGTFTCGEEEPDMPDLIVESIVQINPDCKHYYFANEPNVVDIKIKNIGTAAAGASHAKVDGTSGASATVAVGALAPGASETVTVTDAVARPAGEVVTAIADCDLEVTESDETNNGLVIVDGAGDNVINHGFKGKWLAEGYSGPDPGNMTTSRYYDLNGNLIYSVGDSVYISGYDYWPTYTANWTACDDTLRVPDTATGIVDAWLYVYYTWDKAWVFPDNVSLSFNGVDQDPYDAHYMDRRGYGSGPPSGYNLPYGALVYDVTSEFDLDENHAVLTKLIANTNQASVRGMMLVVVYEDSTEPRRQIYVNEEYDSLYGADSYCTTPDEATARALFTGPAIDLGTVVDADLITIVSGAGSHNNAYNPVEGELIFNGNVWTNAWDFLPGPSTGGGTYGETELGARDLKVTGLLQAAGNAVGMQSSGDWMEASNAILVVTHGERGTECLGSCYNNDTCSADLVGHGMTCAACIATPGNYWHPNKDSNCFGGAVREDLCLDWCPECCDGIDNADEDVDIDFPADQQCSCGLDPSEWNPACPIPELATFTLVGIGLMMFAGVVYRRKE